MEHTILDRALARLNHNSDWLYALAEKLWDSPELGFFEFKTADILVSELEALGLSPRTGIARTGVAAELGAAVEILPLDRIAGAILKKLPRSEGKKV